MPSTDAGEEWWSFILTVVKVRRIHFWFRFREEGLVWGWMKSDKKPKKSQYLWRKLKTAMILCHTTYAIFNFYFSLQTATQMLLRINYWKSTTVDVEIGYLFSLMFTAEQHLGVSFLVKVTLCLWESSQAMVSEGITNTFSAASIALLWHKGHISWTCSRHWSLSFVTRDAVLKTEEARLRWHLLYLHRRIPSDMKRLPG